MQIRSVYLAALFVLFAGCGGPTAGGIATAPQGALAPAAVTAGSDTTLQRLRSGASPLASGPALTIDAGAARRSIDDDIYGITWFYNSASDAAFAAFAKEIRLPVSRHGGDGTSRYNWQVDSSNAGQDWFFTAGNGEAHGTAVPSASIDHMIASNVATGTRQVLTIPTIEWINNDSPWHCGFPHELYPQQQSYNPYVPYGGNECGNGYAADGTQLLGNTPTVSDIPNAPAIQAAWVAHLVSAFGPASHGGVKIYEMDNEPTGWQYMHRDIHPVNTTCEEIASQDQSYAAAVKSVDPSAKILAPDDLPVADVFSCEGMTNGSYFLSQMAAYQSAHHLRILDYYSAHYPSCCGGDPIQNTLNHIALHQGWIAKYYPRTKLAYDEWNVGGPTDLPTALLHADSLGVFGQNGVDLASFWGFNAPTDPTAFIWRMYRNFDGNGSRFGATSISAVSANTAQLTVYAAQRIDGAVTTLVINKTATPVTSALSLAHHTPTGPARIYQYSAANLAAIVHLPDIATSTGSVVVNFPATSITMVVIP